MFRKGKAALILFVATCTVNVAAASQPACLTAPENTLPLPSTVAPGEFVSFEMQVLDFLKTDEYGQLGWCADKAIRDTGPFQKTISYGTHPAVRVLLLSQIGAMAGRRTRRPGSGWRHDD
jgi:hypothetical protein